MTDRCQALKIAKFRCGMTDVPPYAVVGGNPATIIKLRFEQTVIDKLVAIAWWDWPIEKITQHLSAIAGAELTKLQLAD